MTPVTSRAYSLKLALQRRLGPLCPYVNAQMVYAKEDRTLPKVVQKKKLSEAGLFGANDSQFRHGKAIQLNEIYILWLYC